MINEIKDQLLLTEYYFQKGDYFNAEKVLEKILLWDQNNSKANEYLAYIYGNQGRKESSYNYLKKASEQNDCSPEALYYLGTFQVEKNLYQDAINSFKKSIIKGGEFFEVIYEIGAAYIKLNDFEEALKYFEDCLKFEKDSYQIFFNIGRTLDELKRPNEAFSSYNQALKIKPDYIEAWFNGGIALFEIKDYNQAIKYFDKVLSLKSDHIEAYFSKGFILSNLGRFEDAIFQYDQVIKNKPEHINAWTNKGIALHKLHKLDEAIAQYDQALVIRSNFVDALFNKGISLIELGRYSDALACFEKTLDSNPHIDFLYGNLIYAHLKIGSWLELKNLTINCIDRVKNTKLACEPFHLLLFKDDLSVQKKCSQIYITDKYPLNSILGPITKQSRKEKIRIGYFSADFRVHPISFLTAQLFELHDRTQFEIIAFSFGSDDQSQIRHRLICSFDKFFDVQKKTDYEIAELAREIGIDIGVDLMGFTQHSRTGIFAYRAAPIQINWLGYPGTMGAEYIDYIVADKTIIPEAHHHFYNEKVVFLPNSYQVNDRKRVMSDRKFTREELGIPENTFVFCCFNNNHKLLPATFESWMRILKVVEESVLLLLHDNQWVLNNLKKQAEVYGVDKKRLIFLEKISPEEHLARHEVAHLFLDTFPYNAHTTASDALWAGLPVITLVGESFVSRVAASLLNAIDLPELITTSQEQYEALAIELATNPLRLAVIKEKLAKNRLTTPLFDTPLFTKNLEVAYIKIYKRYQENLEPAHIYVV